MGNSPPARRILHLDMDAFFAAVEQRDNPSLRGKPVIVGALPGSRGVVSTAGYEARRYGIHSAMPISEAYRRCPHGVFLRPRMPAYVAESEVVMEILRSFTPVVEQVSIDEAFMDLSGTEKLWGPAEEAARIISHTVAERTGLTASIGVAPNKFLAKIASDLDKPAGITIVPSREERIIAWLAPMPVSRIWGVGRKTQEVLARRGIHTVGDLQRLSMEMLERWFGKQGLVLSDLCRGRDERPVQESEEVKSISREHTFSRDSTSAEHWHRILLALAGDVGRRSRRKGLKGRTVVLTYRTPDFQRHSRRRTLAHPTDLSHDIYRAASSLLTELTPTLGALRLIGVGITGFAETEQTDLFCNDSESSPWHVPEKAMDAIIGRYGRGAIFRAGERTGTTEDGSRPSERRSR